MSRSERAGTEGRELRLLDWRYYLAAQKWRTVLLDEALPTALCDAVREAAENVISCREVVVAIGRGFRPSAPVDLAVIGATSSQAMLEASGYVGPMTVIAVLEVSRTGLSRLSRSTRERREDHGGRSMLMVRAVTGPAAATYYPAANAAARRYVWRNLCPPTSLKAWSARLGVEWTGRAPVCRARERSITLAGPCGFLVPQAGRLIVVSSGRVATNPVIGVEVPAEQRGRTPLRVFKIPRDAAFRAMLDREQSKLTRLQRIMPHTPVRPLGIQPWGDNGRSWAQAAFEGVPFSSLRCSRRLRSVRYLAAWLSDLEGSVAEQVAGGTMRPPEIGPWCHSLARSAQAAFVLDAREREYLRHLPQRMAAGGMRLTFAHRDAGPWNILCSKHQAVLVDWESAGWGLPGEDLIYLLLHLVIEYLAPADRAEVPRLFAAEFMDPQRRPRWLRDLLGPLEKSLAHYEGAFRDVVAMTVLSHALRVYHLSRSSRGKMALDQRFFELWREVVSRDE
jgi:hypothetical protein